MTIQEPNKISRQIAIGSIVSVADFTTDFESGDSFNIRGMKGIVTELYSEDEDGIRLTHAMIRWTADTIRLKRIPAKNRQFPIKLRRSF